MSSQYIWEDDSNMPIINVSYFCRYFFLFLKKKKNNMVKYINCTFFSIKYCRCTAVYIVVYWNDMHCPLVVVVLYNYYRVAIKVILAEKDVWRLHDWRLASRRMSRALNYNVLSNEFNINEMLWCVYLLFKLVYFVNCHIINVINIKALTRKE